VPGLSSFPVSLQMVSECIPSAEPGAANRDPKDERFPESRVRPRGEPFVPRIGQSSPILRFERCVTVRRLLGTSKRWPLSDLDGFQFPQTDGEANSVAGLNCPANIREWLSREELRAWIERECLSKQSRRPSRWQNLRQRI